MKSKTIKKLYTLHSWVGVITGVLLFVIAFTGAFAVFTRPEILYWADNNLRSNVEIDNQKVHDIVQELVTKIPEDYHEEVMIFYPGRIFSNLTILFEAHHDEVVDNSTNTEGKTLQPVKGYLFQYEPNTLTLIKEEHGPIDDIFVTRRGTMAEMIAHFHADLYLGRPVGLILTGVLGLTLMLSIVTGLFIHRKILHQLFTFRPTKSFSLLLNDGHKVIGIWGLIFNSMIAFTGAFLGLVIVILVPAAAFVSFEGDQDKLIETYTQTSEPVIQHVMQPTNIEKILTNIQKYDKEAEVLSIVIKGINDVGAQTYVSLFGGEAIASQTVIYNGQGDIVEQYSNFTRMKGISGPILDIMYPLHFGNFGGVLVKTIWTLLGIGTSLLPLSGLMLWIQRGLNSANSQHSIKRFAIFNRIIIGGCGGLVMSCFFMFPCQQLLTSLFTQHTSQHLMMIFFAVWFIGLVSAFVVRSEKKMIQTLLNLSAIFLLLVLPLDMTLFEYSIINEISRLRPQVIGVDIVTFILGIGCLFLSKQLYKSNAFDKNQTITQRFAQ